MKKRTIIILSILFVVILSTVTFIVIKNSKNNDKPIKIAVKNNLSVNYLDGDELVTGSKSKVYRFSITNNDAIEKYYQIDITDYIDTKGVFYTIKSEDSKISKENVALDSNILVNYAVINPGDTHYYELTITSGIAKNKIGNISIDEYIFEQEYFSQKIISNSTLNQNPQTVVGVDIAQNDEGLIQDIDDDGVTYYFRGNVNNNYFSFANYMWRIVRINGNNTIRVVLDGTTDDLIDYYQNNAANAYFSYNNSSVKNYLSNWYNEKLRPYDKYISTTKSCDNISYTGSEDYIFESSQRLEINHNPTFSCLGNKQNSKITILTADEIEYAGGIIGVVNNNYYLHKDNISSFTWTQTPAKGNKDEFYPYILDSNGSINDTIIGTQRGLVRPVITINKNVSVDGNGTIDSPYEILY